MKSDRIETESETPHLKRENNVLTLVSTDGMKLSADFSTLLPRIRRGNLQSELLVQAVRIRSADHPLKVLDATAGFGEDSFLLAAAGCEVLLYEKDPTIAALLADAMQRAGQQEDLREIVGRMQLSAGDSIPVMRSLAEKTVDVIYLDPMFPARKKSGLVGKKFQLLHYLEKPAEDERELLAAALAAKPQKIVIKRPQKNPFLAGVKPSYSKPGKAIRYDVLLPDSMKDPGL